MTRTAMDIAKHSVEFEWTEIVDGYDVEELGNRYQEYLSGLIQFEMSASGNFREMIGFTSLELRGGVKVEDTNIGGIRLKLHLNT